MARRGIALVLALVSCGPPAPAARVAAEPAAGTESGAETVATEAPAPTTPAEVVATAPRFDVPPPADLAAAIAARLPTLEVVPQTCGVRREPVVALTDRLCLQDPATGLTRAMRRVGLSDEGAVAAARLGDDVVFGVFDPGYAHTRYAGHLWRWTLGDDRYAGLADAGSWDEGWDLVVAATDFGIIASRSRSEGGDLSLLVVGGEVRRLRSVELLSDLAVVEGRTYVRSRRRQREVLSVLRLDGPRVVADEVADYPRAYHLPLLAAFPAGRALVVSAFPREDHTDVYVVEPPSEEVRSLSMAITRPVELTCDDAHCFVRDDGGWHALDLATGALSDGAPTATAPGTTLPAPSRSVHQLFFDDDGLWLAGYESAHHLGEDGVRTVGVNEDYELDLPSAVPAGCDCDDDVLRCGEARVAGGCADVAELDRVTGSDGDAARSTIYSAGGAFRVDRLEPDLTRVTRTSDGARIWVRMLADGIFAQADDGAFEAPASFLAASHALRWGRSLLEAPVTPLAPIAGQFLRPTLIADFFAGRPLPAADTTGPP